MTSRSKTKKKHFREAWDGSGLPIKTRILIAEELQQLAEKLIPYPRYRPFVKSFDSFQDYEKWRKRQANPWLV